MIVDHSSCSANGLRPWHARPCVWTPSSGRRPKRKMTDWCRKDISFWAELAWTWLNFEFMSEMSLVGFGVGIVLVACPFLEEWHSIRWVIQDQIWKPEWSKPPTDQEVKCFPLSIIVSIYFVTSCSMLLQWCVSCSWTGWWFLNSFLIFTPDLGIMHQFVLVNMPVFYGNCCLPFGCWDERAVFVESGL